MFELPGNGNLDVGNGNAVAVTMLGAEGRRQSRNWEFLLANNVRHHGGTLQYNMRVHTVYEEVEVE